MRVIVPSNYEQSTSVSSDIPEELKEYAFQGAVPAYYHGPWGYVLSQYIQREHFSFYQYIVETPKETDLLFRHTGMSFSLFVAEKGALQMGWGDVSLRLKNGFAQMAFVPTSMESKLPFGGGSRTIFYEASFTRLAFEKTAVFFSGLPGLSGFLESTEKSGRRVLLLEDIPLPRTEKELFDRLAGELALPGGPSFFLEPRIAGLLRWYLSQLGRTGDEALISSANFFLTREDLKNARAIQTLLATDFPAKYSLAKLSNFAGMSARKLQQVFRYNTGETISSFRSRVLMNEAARLLKETTDPIKSVALSVGFKYTADFDKLFKKVYGVSPKQWRIQSAG